MKKIAFFIPDLRGGGAERTVANLLKEREAAGQHGKATLQPILHIITGLDMGGAERMLCSLLTEMKARGDRPVVISLRGKDTEKGKGRLAGKLEEAGVPVLWMGMKPGGIPSPAALLRLIRLVRKIRPGLIQGWMYHGDLAAQFVRAFLSPGVPVVWSIHHSPGEEVRGEKPMTEKIIRLGAKLSRKPDAIVYVSEVSRRQHITLGYDDKKAVTIPNGVDPDWFVPSGKARAEVRGELGWKPGEEEKGLESGETEGIAVRDGEPGPGEKPLLIGLLARYHPMKDHENFLRAAALLAARQPDVHFLLAGTGVYSRNAVLTALIVELGIGQRVHLLGERHDSPRILAALDLLTVSSFYGESAPMVLLEAMACGVPCVTTDVGDAAAIVGETGLVVRPRDPDALAEAWERMINLGAEGRKKLGKEARDKVLSAYSLDAVAGEYERLYRRLIFGNRPSS